MDLEGGIFGPLRLHLFLVEKPTHYYATKGAETNNLTFPPVVKKWALPGHNYKIMHFPSIQFVSNNLSVD